MQPETTANFCIVTKPDSRAIALSRKANGYRLPVVHLPKPCWLPGEIAELNSQMMGTFGLNCTTLRWLKRQPGCNLVQMEWHPGSRLPEIDIEWLDPISVSPLLPAEQLQMVSDWQQSSTKSLLPWEQPGWMRRTVLMLIRIFDGVNHPRITNLSQFKAGWGISTLMLIETSGQAYFFKTGITQGVEEYAVTRFLHRKFPDYVRDLFMVDEREGWIISEEIRQTDSAGGDHASVETVFRIYAEIQLGCDEFMSSDDAAGLRVRDETWLRHNLERLFSENDCPREFRQAKSSLSAPQLDALREAWAGQIDQLAASRLPLTFNQEDLHFENVLNTSEGPVFIDWADCAKSHPFFSVHQTLNLWRYDNPTVFERDKEAVKAAYLDKFSHFADNATLRTEFELTGQLSPLYQAFRWQERSQDENQDSAWGSFCFDRSAQRMAKAIERALPKMPVHDISLTG